MLRFISIAITILLTSCGNIDSIEPDSGPLDPIVCSECPDIPDIPTIEYPRLFILYPFVVNAMPGHTTCYDMEVIFQSGVRLVQSGPLYPKDEIPVGTTSPVVSVICIDDPPWPWDFLVVE